MKLKITAVVLFFLSAYSCTKNSNAPMLVTTSGGTSFVAVANASPGSSPFTVFSDSTNIFLGNTLAFGSVTGISGGSPYETINSGNHLIKLSANGTTWTDSSYDFIANNYYTVFFYDTANSTGRLKTLILNDNLSMPTNDQAEIRFLNLSPNSSALNISFINTDKPSGDTTSLTGIPYIGLSSTTSDSLSAFRTIVPGNYKIYLNSAAVKNQNSFAADSVNFAAGRIYTIYAKGYLGGVNGTDSLGLGTITNF
jgi:hypothetical protein